MPKSASGRPLIPLSKHNEAYGKKAGSRPQRIQGVQAVPYNKTGLQEQFRGFLLAME